jgi:hypothetical protein
MYGCLSWVQLMNFRYRNRGDLAEQVYVILSLWGWGSGVSVWFRAGSVKEG